MKKTNEKGLFISIGDLFFWAGILCELAVSFSGYLFGAYKEQVIILIGMAFFALKIVMDTDIKKEWPVLLAITVYGLICYKVQGAALIFRIFLILIAGRDQDARKVMKLFLYVTLAAMVVVGVLSGLGLFRSIYVQDQFRHTFDEIRYTFGFYHPNGFTFFAFRVLLLAIYVYFDKLKWWGLILLGAVYMPFVYMADSKSGMAMGAFLVFFALLAKINFNKVMLRIIFWLGSLAMAAEIIFAYVAMIFYDPHFGPDGYAVGFWQTVNQNIVTGRFTSAFNTFKTYPITLFGMYKGTFTTEIGFVASLYNQGLIFMIIYVLMLFVLFYRMYKQKNQIGMVFMVSMNLYAFSEDFLPYVNKNMLLMLGIGVLFTSLSLPFAKKSAANKTEEGKEDKGPKDKGTKENGSRKTVKVKFTDFWPGFDPEHNYFTDILNQYYNVEISEEPDYLICSSFGNKHVQYMNCIKIMFTGENFSPDFNMFDYALGFNHMTYGDRYLRLPLYALYTDIIEKLKDREKYTDADYLSREGFCCYVVSNMDSASGRKEVIDAVDNYKKLASGGRYRNNVGGPVKDKLEFLKGYRFSLALENSDSDGYTTEKILEAFAGGTVPVYWGNARVKEEFNPEAFIYAGDFKDLDELADYIKSVNEDEEKYLKMAKAPVLKDDSLARRYFENDYANEFIKNIFDQNIEDAYRRNMEYIGRNYQFSMKELQRISDLADLVRKPVHYIIKKWQQLISRRAGK